MERKSHPFLGIIALLFIAALIMAAAPAHALSSAEKTQICNAAEEMAKSALDARKSNVSKAALKQLAIDNAMNNEDLESLMVNIVDFAFTVPISTTSYEYGKMIKNICYQSL